MNTLRPDRLGEALVGKATLPTATLAAADDQIARCLEVLARLTASNNSAAYAIAHTLAHQHIDLTLRAERRHAANRAALEVRILPLG